MTNVIFFDSKSYDRLNFDKFKDSYDVSITYVGVDLNEQTATLAKGYEVACAFVNATIDKKTIDILVSGGTKLLAMRCAGYNNIDIPACCGKLKVVRVPAYSPYAVAEFAMALLLTLVRKTNHAYVRTREFNFSLEGMVGFDLHGKTVGVVGTGKIGKAFISIARGFGMKVLAYDLYPDKTLDAEYVPLPQLLRESDIISLHCPLTKENHHMIGMENIATMKTGAILINTSRGALVDAGALLEALRSKKLGGAALDVYEEERNLFYEDNSGEIIDDDLLTLLIALPNVIVTSHQAFLTDDALRNIADTTLSNIKEWRECKSLTNEVCMDCPKHEKPECNGKKRK